MENKKVLVLLSSYNGEKYIDAQIKSILNQKTNHTVNLLIRDDGSSDNTIAIINKYIQEYPNRIELIKGENIGYIKSFFELIKVADNYDYYALSDQDDVWLENKIDVGIQYLMKEDNSIPLLYGSTSYLVGDDLKPYGKTQEQLKEITFYNTIIQNFFPGHNQIMNQKLLDELKKEIDYSKIYVHDSWITNVAMLCGKLIFNNDSFTYYRQHQENEIGFGKGTLGWIKERLKRIKKSDNKKYANQINYFFHIYKEKMSSNQYKEINKFITNQKNYILRFKYILKSKLYRQRNIETLLFKVLYLIGGYKI